MLIKTVLDKAAIEIGLDIIWLQLNRFVVLFNSIFKIANRVVCYSTIKMSLCFFTHANLVCACQ